MRYVLLVGLFVLAALGHQARAQGTSGNPLVVASCGTLPTGNYNAGTYAPFTVDTTGKWCTNEIAVAGFGCNLTGSSLNNPVCTTGTFKNGTVSAFQTGPATVEIGGTQAVSTASTTVMGLSVDTVFTPTNSAVVALDGIIVKPHLGLTAATSITDFEGVFVAGMVIDAGYMNTQLPPLIGMEATQVTNNSSATPNNFYEFYADPNATGASITSGTVSNISFYSAGWTGAGGVGGQLNNWDFYATMPSGSSATTSSRGYVVAGNCPASSSDCYAFYSGGTPPSYLGGILNVLGGNDVIGGTSTTPEFSLTNSLTTSSGNYFNVNGTLSSSISGPINALSWNPVIAPTGTPTNISSAAFQGQLSGSVTPSGSFATLSVGPVIAAGYGGTAVTVNALQLNNLINSSSTVITAFRQLNFNAATNCNGTTTSTCVNTGILLTGASAVPGSGGTITNTNLAISLPTGTNAGTETATGLSITGNGPTGGTITVYAINSTSTAIAQFAGDIYGPLGGGSNVTFGYSGNVKTGMYFPNANQVSLCGNSSCGLTVNGAGQITAALGIFSNSTTIPTPAAGNVVFAGSQATAPTMSANGEGAIWLGGASGTTLGLTLMGKGSTDDFAVLNDAGSTVLAIPTGTTNLVGAGTLTGLTGLTSSGTITFSGVTTGTNADFACFAAGGVMTLQSSACTISSKRFKNLRGDYQGDALAEIARLHPAVFTMKGTNPDWNYDRPQIGLIAENVAEVDMLCAIYEQDGVTAKSYRQECVIALLTRAVQQQQTEIERLKRMH